MHTSYIKQAVLALSGGMDSSTLLLRLLAEGYKVTALSFDYGQKHRVELDKAQSLVNYLNHQLPGLGYVKIEYQVIQLNGLSQLLNSTLVTGGADVPEGHYAEENMKATVVPNRNKIFSSIIQAVALSIADKHNCEVKIALGIHAGDHCFTRETNILTPDGLKTIETLKKGDAVYSYNLQTNTWELDTVQEVWQKGIAEKVMNIKTHAGTLRVTDQHQVYKLNLGDFHRVYGYTKTIEKVPAKALKTGEFLVQPTGIISHRDTITQVDLKPILEPILEKYEKGLTLQEEDGYLWLGGHTPLYRNNKIPRLVDAKCFVELCAWYIAEGWSSKTPYTSKNGNSRYTAAFTQSLKANLEKVEYIQEMINRGSFPISFQFSKRTHNGIPKEVTYFVSNVLAALLKECGSHSKVKKAPNWLMDILLQDLELREAFLYVLGIADGFNTEGLNKGFCTTSPELLRQVITLAQLSGYHVSIGKKTTRGTVYLIYSKLNQKQALIALGQAKFTEILSIEEEAYNDHVYDLSVEKNHNFAAGEYGSLLISNSIYPDCRQEFRDADELAFKIGNWNSEKVSYYTPYLEDDKFGILKDGLQCCDTLHIDFDQVYSRTNTSYKPICIFTGMTPSGPNYKWYSDYKSASSVERVEAFIKLGRKDPVDYADETGPVSWEVAKTHAQSVLDAAKQLIFSSTKL